MKTIDTLCDCTVSTGKHQRAVPAVKAHAILALGLNSGHLFWGLYVALFSRLTKMGIYHHTHSGCSVSVSECVMCGEEGSDMGPHAWWL